PTNVAAVGGSGTATITPAPNNSAGCSWTGSVDVSWLSLSGNTSGGGSGSFTYTVAANSDTASRTGRIVVNWSGGSTGSTNSAVSQDAAVPTNCTLTTASDASVAA